MDESKLLQGHFAGPVLMLVICFVCSLGILRENGPVKAFNEPVWRLKGVKILSGRAIVGNAGKWKAWKR